MAPSSGGAAADYTNGMPNTYMFQVQPLALTKAQCPAGSICCDNWVLQTPHTLMNVAMCDGSVRPVSPGLSKTIAKEDSKVTEASVVAGMAMRE